MRALFESVCGDCDEKIRTGEEIARTDRGAWAHVVCPPSKLDLQRPVCTVCFTEISVSGACMCGAAS